MGYITAKVHQQLHSKTNEIQNPLYLVTKDEIIIPKPKPRVIKAAKVEKTMQLHSN
jgi:hypothetical protein